MPVTIASLVDQALRKIGALPAGSSAEPEEHRDALAVFRQMLDGWSLEDLMIPYRATERFDLDQSKNFYRMGSGGEFDTVRPETVEVVRVEDIAGQVYLVRETSLEVLARRTHFSVARPSYYVLHRDSLFVSIEFSDYPYDPYVLVTTRKPFNVVALDDYSEAYDGQSGTIYPSGFTLTGIQSEIDFPSGYERAIVNNLAVELSPEYARQPPAQVVAAAVRSKQLIKARNRPTETLITDGGLERRTWPGFYDVTSGP